MRSRRSSAPVPSPLRCNAAGGQGAIRAAGSAVRLATALLIALTLCWQATVLRAHVHWPHVAGHAQMTAQATGQVHVAPHRTPPADTDQHCPICAETADAADYIAPAPAVLAAPGSEAAWHIAGSCPAGVWHCHSHGWRSRAPPGQPHPIA